MADGLVGRRIVTQNKEEIIEYVPEYLVLVKELTKIAKEYGLELQESLNFHDFYGENIQEYKYFNVFKNKIQFDFSGESPLLMDPELWDVSYLYRYEYALSPNHRIAAFKKVQGPEIQEMDRSIFKERNFSKIYRKKKFNFLKKEVEHQPFDKKALLEKLNKKLEERKATETQAKLDEDSVSKKLKI